jgi:hypothetical protein
MLSYNNSQECSLEGQTIPCLRNCFCFGILGWCNLSCCSWLFNLSTCQHSFFQGNSWLSRHPFVNTEDGRIAWSNCRWKLIASCWTSVVQSRLLSLQLFCGCSHSTPHIYVLHYGDTLCRLNQTQMYLSSQYFCSQTLNTIAVCAVRSFSKKEVRYLAGLSGSLPRWVRTG